MGPKSAHPAGSARSTRSDCRWGDAYLYRARNQTVTVNASTLDDLLAQRDGVYATLRDLELDRELGKLDANDYAALRERNMLRATEILQQLDLLRGEGSAKQASSDIEKEVAALRHTPTPSSPQPVAKPASTKSPRPATANQRTNTNGQQPKANDSFCTNCGRPYTSGDKFCARCGHALS